MKKFISFIAGFITCAVLVVPMASYAQVATKNIDVLMGGIKVTLNGHDVPTDAEPLMYSDRTYLPIRAVAEALNLNVNWNDTAATAELSNKPVPIIPSIPEITPAPTPTPIRYDVTTYNGMEAITYDGSVYLILHDTFPVYHIEMQYELKTNTLILSKDSKTQSVDLSSINNAITYRDRIYISKTILDKFLGQ